VAMDALKDMKNVMMGILLTMMDAMLNA
jgi:hypothetical protein